MLLQGLAVLQVFRRARRQTNMARAFRRAPDKSWTVSGARSEWEIRVSILLEGVSRFLWVFCWQIDIDIDIDVAVAPWQRL